jgi:O-antigen/teichoic acid export membrane protein
MSTVGRKLAIGSSLNTLYLVATALISVLIMPFVVHSLGDRLYGIWALAAAVISYYNVLELGLSSAVGRFVAGALGSGDKQQLNRVYNTSLLIFTLIGLIVLVISVAAAAASTLFIKNPLDASIFWRAILILGASLAIGFPMRVLKGVLEADLRFGPSAGVDLLVLFIRTALLIVFIKMGARVVGLAWATLLANLPALILYPYFVRRNMPSLHLSRSFWKLSTSKDLFSYSIVAFIAQAGGLLRGNFSPFIVASFLGLGAVTHLKVVQSLNNYAVHVVVALIGVFQPVFSRQDGAKDYEGLRKTLLFSTKISLSVASLAAFGLLALGRPFITRWMGTSYLDAYPCFALLVIGVGFGIAQRPSAYVLFALARHRFLAITVMIEGVLNIVLSVILVPRIGLLGIGLGTLIPMFITKVIVQPIYVCRVSGLRYEEYFWTVAGTMAKVMLACVIPFLLILKFAVPSYLGLIVLGAITAILYGLPLAITVFDTRESQLLIRTLGPFLRMRRAQ